MSNTVLLLKSATQIEIGRDAVVEISVWLVKDLFPNPKNMPTLLVPKFATAISNRESLLKSPTVTIRAPDGPGWAEKKKPMGFYIFYWPGPSWAGPELCSPAHALA